MENTPEAFGIFGATAEAKYLGKIPKADPPKNAIANAKKLAVEVKDIHECRCLIVCAQSIRFRSKTSTSASSPLKEYPIEWYRFSLSKLISALTRSSHLFL